MPTPTQSPIANPENVLIINNVRFSFLSHRFVRIEHSLSGEFTDNPTFAVINRAMPIVSFHKTYETVEGAKILRVKTESLEIVFDISRGDISPESLQIITTLDGLSHTWRYGDEDPQNLHGTRRTLDRMKGMQVGLRDAAGDTNGWQDAHLEKGVLSRSGFGVFDDSENVSFEPRAGYFGEWPVGRSEDCIDIYFLAYGQDYTGAIEEMTSIFGRMNLPPRYSLGFWYSRYFPFTDEDIRELVEQSRDLKIPMDVMVIDMEWHKTGWTGYSWDKSYFPDPPKLLGWMKDQHIKTTLNLHPADGVYPHEDAYDSFARAMGQDPKSGDPVPFDIADTGYMENYFKLLHHPLEEEGVDFWWMDWQQGNRSNIRNLDPLMLVNKLHYEDMEKSHPDKRPLIFSRYSGMGSGRYPIGFSGDTYISWESLAVQPWFTATSANVLYGYWSHDIGGHYRGDLTPELFLRWIQYGVYSPILRIHSGQDRRLWEQPSPYRWMMIREIRKRYELTPYIYGEMRKGYDTGVSLCHPLYYSYPDCEEAYTYKDEYCFGSEMIVAPITAPVDEKTGLVSKDVWLPEGVWIDTATGVRVAGNEVYTGQYSIEETPVFVKAGAVIPGLKDAQHLDISSYEKLIFTCYGGIDTGENSYTLYEDDGITTAYGNGQCTVLTISQQIAGTTRTIAFEAVKGTYKGYITQKEIELRFPCAALPESVYLNGSEISSQAIGYDGAGLTVSISVQIDVSKQNTFTIHFPELDARELEGIPGEFIKLRALKEEVRSLMRGGKTRLNRDKDRYYFQLMGVCDRINYDPANVIKEIRAFQTGKEEYLAIIGEYRMFAQRIIAFADKHENLDGIHDAFPEVDIAPNEVTRIVNWSRRVEEVLPLVERVLQALTR